jgi:hypothetical protein
MTETRYAHLSSVFKFSVYGTLVLSIDKMLFSNIININQNHWSLISVYFSFFKQTTNGK